MKEIDIVYEDTSLLVLDKPPGLLAVPGVGPDKKDCLSARVQAAYPSATVVHRLDRDTSGLMVMALNPNIHRALSAQFEHRKVSKTYHAVVAGTLEKQRGTIDLPIHRDWQKHNPPMYKVDHERGKSSVTHWHVLKQYDEQASLELYPQTGRSHQLRLHLLTIGHPILGDNIYAPDTVKALANRLMLHASILKFQHPTSRETVQFKRMADWVDRV